MSVTNLTALCFAAGHQGGTIHLMARELDVSPQDILNADDDKMEYLLRRAQGLARQRYLAAGYAFKKSDDKNELVDDDGLYLGKQFDLDKAQDDCMYLTGGVKP